MPHDSARRRETVLIGAILVLGGWASFSARPFGTLSANTHTLPDNPAPPGNETYCPACTLGQPCLRSPLRRA